jgi:hypothetical protein
LSSVSKQNFLHAQPIQHTLRAAVALLIATAPFAAAQSPLTSTPAADVIAANTHFDLRDQLDLLDAPTLRDTPGLPDSPGARLSTSSNSADDESGDPGGQTPKPTGPRPKATTHLAMVVEPNEVAQPMSVKDKVVGGITSSTFSLYSALGWLASAGWEQATNGSPNYGTNSTAFGQRFGAAVARNVSEGIFSISLFAPIFHEDPRYYVMGSGHPFVKRLVYAGTRVLITRSDSGHSTPNLSLIAGNAAGSALTIEYYPAKNTSFGEVAETFGGSLGGSALGYVVDEFIVDALIKLHIRKHEPQP